MNCIMIFQNFDNLLTFEELINYIDVQWRNYKRLGFSDNQINLIFFENPIFRDYFIQQSDFDAMKLFFKQKYKML